MRMTVNLEPDVYAFAKAYAGGKGISLSVAIGELLRRAELSPELGTPSGRLRKNEHGYLEIAATGHAVTPEMVNAAAEEELL